MSIITRWQLRVQHTKPFSELPKPLEIRRKRPPLPHSVTALLRAGVMKPPLALFSLSHLNSILFYFIFLHHKSFSVFSEK